MKGNSIRVNKFIFTYHKLAYKVRQNMLNALRTYDKNSNGLFEQRQIVEALVGILNEDQNEIRYVISNVFRYDRDNDKAVTYEQLVNFAVEQHFGQMAIQRLHRNGLYTRGKQRVMNFDEFEVTLNQSLKHIDSQGDREQYRHLFNQIDLDHDGWIKYEDFFMFLREYFGSMSIAASGPQQPVKPVEQPPKTQPQSDYVPQVQFAEQRFARLIYTQLKVIVMEHDLNRCLTLTRQQVAAILTNVFHIRPEEKQELTNLIVGGQDVIDYERFMKVTVPFYFCEYNVHHNDIGESSEDYFVHLVQSAASFLPVKPSSLVLKQIFRKADIHKKGFLQRTQYINTLGMILQNYEFDQRGKGVETHYIDS